VLIGVFGVLFVVAAAGYYTLNVRGLSIFIDQEQLAAAVRDKVRARAGQELPAILAKLADDATAQLLAESEAPSLTVEIGGRRLALPAEATAFLWNEFRGVAKESVGTTLKEFDLSPYANELAEEAYGMVQETLAREIYGKTFRFRANRWISLPVTVQGRPE